MNHTYTRAASLYKNTQSSGAGPRELVAGLLWVLIRNLEMGKEQYQLRQLDRMMQYNQKSFHLLHTLLSCLKADTPMPKEVQQLNSYLRSTYRRTFTRLVNILTSKDPAAEFDSCIATLKTIHRAWQAKAEPTASLSSETASVPSFTEMVL